MTYWDEDIAEAARLAEAAENEGRIEDVRQRCLVSLIDLLARRERMAKAARAVVDVYDEARLRGVVQGHCVLEGAFLFSDWARNTPRWSYVLLGADGALYCGSTNDLRRRLSEHRAGVGAVLTAVRSQRWWLLHAERHSDSQKGFAAEMALLHSQVLQRAFLAASAPRVTRLHERFGVVVPWLGLGDCSPDAEAQARRVARSAAAEARAARRDKRAAKLRAKLARVPWLRGEAEVEAEVQRRLAGGVSRFWFLVPRRGRAPGASVSRGRATSKRAPAG